jgi:hypothetical protein
MNYVICMMFAVLVSPTRSSICNELLDASEIVSTSQSGEGCPRAAIGEIRPISNTTEVCFSDRGSNSFSILAKSDYILRRIELPGASGMSVRLSAFNGNETQWYISPVKRDVNAQWSTIPVNGDGVVEISPDVFAFSNLTVWINSTDPITLHPALYGCRADTTQTVDYMFNSSARAVGQTFGALAFLEKIIVSILSSSGGMDPKRVTLRYAESNDPTVIIIRVTVLPTSETESPSVQSIVEYLSTNPMLLSALKRVQELITDTTAYLCFDKICPEGSMCVNGKCVTQDLPGEGHDPLVRPERPVGVRAYANNIQASESAAATSESWLSVYGPYIIPLMIGGATLVVIVALLALRWYKRKIR